MTVRRSRLDRLPGRSAESTPIALDWIRMSAQPAPSTVSFVRPRSETVLCYELNVVASTAAAVVSGLGGWLFDRRMAGWSVGVALTERGDDRALEILGVKVVELSGVWGSVRGDAEHVAMTVIATDRFESDGAVRSRGLDALRAGSSDVAFWGLDCPRPLSGQFHPTRYRPSAAARAFKAHALAAAGLPMAGADLPETVFRCGTAAGALDSDLVPVW